MRPIKFRAWFEREDFEPDENYMFDVKSIERISEYVVEINDAHTFNPHTNESDGVYAPAKLYLMQSTGILDKNKIEIFEGDIVEYQGRANKHPFGGGWENVISGVGEIRYEFAGYFIFERESEDTFKLI